MATQTNDNALLKALLFAKTTPAPGLNPNFFGVDAMGSLISADKIGKRKELGSEIDHIIPVAAGGTENLANLQLLQWQNNRKKSDKLPSSPLLTALYGL